MTEPTIISLKHVLADKAESEAKLKRGYIYRSSLRYHISLCATVEAVYLALKLLLALIEHETTLPSSAANGVTAPDGTDEGVARVSSILKAVRDLLAQLESKE